MSVVAIVVAVFFLCLLFGWALGKTSAAADEQVRRMYEDMRRREDEDGPTA